ncbi:hypothetical protein [Fusobacterium hwasookii]|uniref:Uncharacterized protein n=1 Tax=Fusobacterium hwasookii ChDC F206 TaxID=1307443 RepID=A0AAC8WK50_9FUSO|nr:hypothetical protein [Fusobacterium hwasookii]ALQ35533.1 hypothetical protein RN92_06385 [Fusobacterium hwasookii ChDC F206]
MEKENVLEIEFQKVWDMWAWRVVKNDIPYSKELKEIEFNGIKVINTHKNSLFFLNSFEDGYEQLEDFELILKDEKLEIEKFIRYVNQKYGIPKRWRVEKGKKYYFLNTECEIRNIWEDKTKEDETRYNLGNYFKTEEEAQKVKEELDKFWERVRAGEIGGDE